MSGTSQKNSRIQEFKTSTVEKKNITVRNQEAGHPVALAGTPRLNFDFR